VTLSILLFEVTERSLSELVKDSERFFYSAQKRNHSKFLLEFSRRPLQM
jgi:hypothetical protein